MKHKCCRCGVKVESNRNRLHTCDACPNLTKVETSRYYNHKITPKEFAEMLQKYSNQCAVCGTSDWRGRKNRPHIDHDHKTGKVRGILCHNCNLALGLLKDDINILQAMIRYLKF